MSALIGRAECTLDAKNRLFAPARYREQLAAEGGRHFFLACSPDRCLMLFLPSQWEHYLQKVESQKFDSARHKRWHMRDLFSNSYEAVPDEQGRILIQQKLKDYAGLKKDVVIIGAGSKAELWDKEAWEAVENSSLKDFKKLSAELDL